MLKPRQKRTTGAGLRRSRMQTSQCRARARRARVEPSAARGGFRASRVQGEAGSGRGGFRARRVQREASERSSFRAKRYEAVSERGEFRTRKGVQSEASIQQTRQME